MVIPDLKILNQDPQKAIIIKFDKDLSTSGYTKRLHEILPLPEDNLWLVSATPLSLPYRNYIIFKNKIDEKFNIFYNNDNDKDNNFGMISISKKIKTTNLNSDSIKNRLNVIPFYNIIVDINKFLMDTNHTGFKFLH